MKARLTHGTVTIEVDGTPEEVVGVVWRLGEVRASKDEPWRPIGPDRLPDDPPRSMGIKELEELMERIRHPGMG